eukprot:m.81124 g.81124  ORF g.81124 m.81124 type:complete len:317 (-) comp8642_c1_seq7:620-1570(-)
MIIKIILLRKPKAECANCGSLGFFWRSVVFNLVVRFFFLNDYLQVFSSSLFNSVAQIRIQVYAFRNTRNLIFPCPEETKGVIERRWCSKILGNGNGWFCVEHNMPPTPRYIHNISFILSEFNVRNSTLLQCIIIGYKPFQHRNRRCNSSSIRTWVDPRRGLVWRCHNPSLLSLNEGIPRGCAVWVNVPRTSTFGGTNNHPSVAWSSFTTILKYIIRKKTWGSMRIFELRDLFVVFLIEYVKRSLVFMVMHVRVKIREAYIHIASLESSLTTNVCQPSPAPLLISWPFFCVSFDNNRFWVHLVLFHKFRKGDVSRFN